MTFRRDEWLLARAIFVLAAATAVPAVPPFVVVQQKNQGPGAEHLRAAAGRPTRSRLLPFKH